MKLQCLIYLRVVVKTWPLKDIKFWKLFKLIDNKSYYILPA